jgi:hypothetical protein
MQYRTFWLPKRGNSAAEYEDAFAADARRGRFALADGATESSFAEPWARLLVDAFVGDSTAARVAWEDWLPPLQQQWLAQVGQRPLPWYAEDKLQTGAFATFLGLIANGTPGAADSTAGRWAAVAVGDTCLFQVRDDALRCAFPVTDWREFGTNPWLIGSRSPPAQVGGEKQVLAAGSWRAGDRFWLMTDALAQWFLRRFESGKKPWKCLASVSDAPDRESVFARWIDSLRDAQEIRNDDVTLVALRT